jgi:transcriptional regulator with XRE-family HTH domain
MTRAQGDITARVAGRIRRLRKSRGIIGEQMVRDLETYGVKWARSTLVNLETGRRDALSVDELVAFAAALGVEPVDLLSPQSDCAKCGGSPPPGFTCNACGTVSAAGAGA